MTRILVVGWERAKIIKVKKEWYRNLPIAKDGEAFEEYMRTKIEAKEAFNESQSKL